MYFFLFAKNIFTTHETKLRYKTRLGFVWKCRTRSVTLTIPPSLSFVACSPRDHPVAIARRPDFPEKGTSTVDGSVREPERIVWGTQTRDRTSYLHAASSHGTRPSLGAAPRNRSMIYRWEIYARFRKRATDHARSIFRLLAALFPPPLLVPRDHRHIFLLSSFTRVEFRPSPRHSLRRFFRSVRLFRRGNRVTQQPLWLLPTMGDTSTGAVDTCNRERGYDFSDRWENESSGWEIRPTVQALMKLSDAGVHWIPPARGVRFAIVVLRCRFFLFFFFMILFAPRQHNTRRSEIDFIVIAEGGWRNRCFRSCDRLWLAVDGNYVFMKLAREILYRLQLDVDKSFLNVFD